MSAKKKNMWIILGAVFQVFAIFCGIMATIESKKAPTLELEFLHKNNLSYLIKNNTKDVIAENILISFAIVDLDSLVNPVQSVPITGKTYDYVNPKMRSGPYNILGNLGKNGNRYLGWLYLNCKGCQQLKIYWVYFELRVNSTSFYAEKKDTDTSTIDFMKASKDQNYIDELIPTHRRKYIRN